MPRVDIVVEIIYNIKEPEKTVIKTNAKPEAVSEVLEAWLTAQMGEGRDSREPISRGLYKVSIKLDLRDDTFFTTSDTGNSGLTAGIVMNATRHLDKIQISALS